MIENTEVDFTMIEGRPCLTAHQVENSLTLAAFVARFRNSFKRDVKLGVYWYERRG